MLAGVIEKNKKNLDGAAGCIALLKRQKKLNQSPRMAGREAWTKTEGRRQCVPNKKKEGGIRNTKGVR